MKNYQKKVDTNLTELEQIISDWLQSGNENLTHLAYLIDNYYFSKICKHTNNGNIGDISKQFNTTIGELGCRHCGSILSGRIVRDNCIRCGTKYIEDEIN